ncbi:MAG: EutN/CcmL family microcompartment protein [Clostridiales bacterium]|jgi:ethanolamine utilization protein EutN|nr:EutN/CcmL family microcompartment protein [Clostridiales bacterium]
MQICQVKGSIVSTRKDEKLVGSKLMLVEPSGSRGPASGSNRIFVAVDMIGAGVGETVLVARGSAARKAFGRKGAPVDAAIVGIVDEGTYNLP